MPIHTERHDHVAEVVIDFPKVNALAIADTQALAAHIDELGAEPEVRCIVLSAPEKYFCVGADVKELNRDATLIGRCNRGWRALFNSIYDCPAPVIGAVSGYCLGGGCGIAGACDVLFASEDAVFGLPEVKVGALGGATYLMRLVGLQKTRACMYTGESLSAAEVAVHGSIEAVLPRDALAAGAREMAAKIAANSPEAVRLAKESLNGIEGRDIDKCYRWEQGFTLELYTSPESAQARARQVESGFKS